MKSIFYALSLGFFLLSLVTGCGAGGGKRTKLLTTTEVKQQVMGLTREAVVELLGKRPDYTRVEVFGSSSLGGMLTT